MKKYLSTFILAFLAGICISLGGMVFLKLKDAFPGSDIIGAILFGIGLFTICTRGYNLFTGKACYTFGQRPKYLLTLLIIWLGNFLGCIFMATIIYILGNNGNYIMGCIISTANALISAKMSQNWLNLFILSIICNLFIYIAVDGYRSNPHRAGKYLAIFLGVSVFIICGTEHSVADMFYWSVSGQLFANFGSSLICILIITAGNFTGALIMPGLERISRRLISQK